MPRRSAALGSKGDPRTRRPHRRGLPRPGRVGAGALARDHGDGCRGADLRRTPSPAPPTRSCWARASRATPTRRTDACASRRSPGWVAATHGILPSSALFHAVIEKRHLATPDGIAVDHAGRITSRRDQDDQQVVAQHPPFLSAAGVVAAARPRRGAHAHRVGGARRVRPGGRRAPLPVGRPRRCRDRQARAPRDRPHRRTPPQASAGSILRPVAPGLRGSPSAPSPSPTDPICLQRFLFRIRRAKSCEVWYQSCRQISAS